MIRIAALVFGVSFAALALAQETKWEPPPTPEGWKAVISKDGRYRFVIPKDAKSSGTRDRTSSLPGLRVAIQVNYCTLKDGTVFEVRGVTLSGSELKGKTVNQVIDMLFIDVEKEDGYKISEPKEATVGDIKAREYRLSKDKQSRRLVLFGVKPRVFALEVAATDAAQLDTEAANTFLKSFVLVPAEVVKAAAKERAEKQEAADKENVAKYGAKWTTDLKEMTAPDAPAVGVIRGREFKPDAVTLQPGGKLLFRQGSGMYPDVEVELWLILKPNESVENKTYEVGKGVKSAVTPHVRLATLPEGAKFPKSEAFLANYSLKLTFAAKDKDGSIPGTIYLCTPDTAHSFLAGKFAAKEK
jgi:hypothetical protein